MLFLCAGCFALVLYIAMTQKHNMLQLVMRYAAAAIPAEQGIVNIHAQTICPATPHRTAVMRFSDPTPVMAPVMVCVVLTGIPKNVDTNNVMAAPVSAQKPSTGRSFVIFCPIVFTILHPPHSVPAAIAAWQERTTHRGI